LKVNLNAFAESSAHWFLMPGAAFQQAAPGFSFNSGPAGTIPGTNPISHSE
jgi:hypothetical protein